MQAAIDAGILKKWKWLVAGAALWWLLGINLFVYHAAAFLLFVAMMHTRDRSAGGIFMPPTAALLFCIACIYGFSILINSADGDMSRVVAAMYNLSFWIMGGLVVLLMANIFRPEDSSVVYKTFRILAWITGATAAAMAAAWTAGIKAVVIPTPLYGLTRFLGDTTLVESSLLVRPLLWDWFASLTRPRFNVFSPYPTAAGGILVIILLMLVTEAVSRKKLHSPSFWLLFSTNLLGLIMTLSRMSFFAFIVSLAVVYVLQKRNFLPWLLFFVAVLLVTAPLIQDMLEFFLSLREGSNSVRLQLYRYSLQQLEGVDWIFGLGLKPRESYFSYPLGSHSTYVSLIFKSGFLGGLLYILFQATLFLRWYALKPLAILKRDQFAFWRGMGMVFIAMGMWTVTEDIDAPQMLALLYFSFVGFFEGFRKELIYGNAKTG